MFGAVQPLPTLTKLYDPEDSDSMSSLNESSGDISPKSSVFESKFLPDRSGAFSPVSAAKHHWYTISSTATFYLRRFGIIGQNNTKKVIAALASILISYYIISFIDFGPPATDRTEYSSPKLQLLRKLDENPDYKIHGLNFQLESHAVLDLESSTLQQLAKAFPYDRNEPLPKHMWQIWLNMNANKNDYTNIPDYFKDLSQTWKDHNPGYKYNLLIDDECHKLVRELYADVPDVIRAYEIMPKTILQVDFFRYLILFAKGGVYSDMDTKAHKPIDDWASSYPIVYAEDSNPGLVIGVEADPAHPDWAQWFARPLQFCQWTIQSKKGHPVLCELIARIADITLAREEVGELDQLYGKDASDDIMEWTGPGIFSDYVYDYLNNVVQASSDFKRRKYASLFTPEFFSHMELPIVIDDVMILPITSFSPDIGWMGAKDSSDPMAYVGHMFSGTWRGHD